MTDEQRKRIHDITYSADDRMELAERIVKLEDERDKQKFKFEVLKAHGIEIVDAVGGGHEIYDTRQREVDRLEYENAKLRDTTYAWRTVDRLSCENAKLRKVALKNWYIALSEREALSAHDIDPDGGTYMAALDDEIATAKDRMRELGIEVE